jgi:hypothetical protein
MLLNNPHFQLPYKKATISHNVLLYNMFNLKAPLFKGGWGDQENLNLLMGVFRIRPALALISHPLGKNTQKNNCTKHK